jgi:polysaccharide chain length determinant protein (PEP-CTERM system associated)
MLERLSVPRRALDFEDYVDILRRNVRWIIGPVFAGLVISTVVAFLMEDTFVSKALIRIVPQQISTDIIQNVSSQDVADRINGMAQSILSRNTLTTLITAHGLYKKEIASEPMEDVVNKMRDAIKIRPTAGVAVTGKTMPAMEVSFSYRDRLAAKAVCDDLVSRFMGQSTQDTLDTQLQANQFLNDEFERAKHDLDVLEQKLSDFRQRNAGRLPEEMQLNISQMNALEGRLSGLNEAAARNNEQRMMLETALHTAKDRLASIRATSPELVAHSQKVKELDRKIEEVQDKIASMKDRYTDDYPDLQAARDELALLQRQREEATKEKVNQAKDDTVALDTSGVTRERMDAQAAIQQLQTQLKANSLEGQQINGQMASVSNALKVYQGRVEEVPAGEKEYADLLRDRDLAKQTYSELQAKREKSSVSMDLERRKQGESLEVLDQASLPDTPTAPKRQLIIPIGAVIGLIAGVIIVAVREVKDTSLKNLKDARLYTQLSILGSIPLLENDLVVQRRKQIMWVGWATATLAGLAIVAGSVAHYYMTLNQGSK